MHAGRVDERHEVGAVTEHAGRGDEVPAPNRDLGPIMQGEHEVGPQTVTGQVPEHQAGVDQNGPVLPSGPFMDESCSLGGPGSAMGQLGGLP